MATKQTEEDPLFYFNKKVEELDLLLKQATSKTLTNLVEQAKEISHLAVNDLLLMQRTAIVYLEGCDERTKSKLSNYKKELEGYATAKMQLEQAKIPVAQKAVAKLSLKTQLNSFQNKMTVEANLNDLVYKTHHEVVKQLRIVLLELIFVPNNKNFNIERVFDAINYVLENKIPLLSEIKAVSGLSNKAKRKKQVTVSNQLLRYIENYIEAVEKWSHLNSAYVKILVEEIAPSLKETTKL
jgi:hypothetical protein